METLLLGGVKVGRASREDFRSYFSRQFNGLPVAFIEFSPNIGRRQLSEMQVYVSQFIDPHLARFTNDSNKYVIFEDSKKAAEFVAGFPPAIAHVECYRGGQYLASNTLQPSAPRNDKYRNPRQSKHKPADAVENISCTCGAEN